MHAFISDYRGPCLANVVYYIMFNTLSWSGLTSSIIRSSIIEHSKNKDYEIWNEGNLLDSQGNLIDEINYQNQAVEYCENGCSHIKATVSSYRKYQNDVTADLLDSKKSEIQAVFFKSSLFDKIKLLFNAPLYNVLPSSMAGSEGLVVLTDSRPYQIKYSCLQDGENYHGIIKCPDCDTGLFCNVCQYFNSTCPNCGLVAFAQSSDQTAVNNRFQLHRTGYTNILDADKWNGDDFVGLNLVSGRLLDFLSQESQGPFVAWPALVATKGRDPEEFIKYKSHLFQTAQINFDPYYQDIEYL